MCDECEELRRALAERDAAERMLYALAKQCAAVDRDPEGVRYFIWWAAEHAELVDGPDADDFIGPLCDRLGLVEDDQTDGMLELRP